MLTVGGLAEIAVKLPGNAQDSGFWAAAWLEGNLGRAGHLRSTAGRWPYSYDMCNGSGKLTWSAADGQRESRCTNNRGTECCKCLLANSARCGVCKYILLLAGLRPSLLTCRVTDSSVTLKNCLRALETSAHHIVNILPLSHCRLCRSKLSA